MRHTEDTHCCYRVGNHSLVRISLHPPLEGQLQPGSTLAGTLDFRFSQAAAQEDTAAPKCVQVVIMLETEERVQDQWQAPSKRQAAPIRKVSMYPYASNIMRHSTLSCTSGLLSHAWPLDLRCIAALAQHEGCCPTGLDLQLEFAFSHTTAWLKCCS